MNRQNIRFLFQFLHRSIFMVLLCALFGSLVYAATQTPVKKKGKAKARKEKKAEPRKTEKKDPNRVYLIQTSYTMTVGVTIVHRCCADTFSLNMMGPS